MKYKSMQGFSFIEILISLFILSLMLLGLDAMEIFALRTTKQAFVFSMAVNQLENMQELLRSFYADECLEKEIILWNQQNAGFLPNGKGFVTGTFPLYTVIVTWGVNQDATCKQNQIGQSGCLREEIKI